ncbi:MAG: hypothetical protein II232_01315, partial [Spirochaetaceae bacterium]|nr:hypothetical protein [Spirochaetaceae bacterium]
MFFKRIIFIFTFLFFIQDGFSQKLFFDSKEFDSKLFGNFVKSIEFSYPDNFVRFGFDSSEQLWFVDLKNDDIKKSEEKIKRFFYKNARVLPKENLQEWKNYNPLFTEFYPKEIPEPENFSELKIEYLKDLSLPENRDSYKPSSFTFVQNFLYKASTQKEIEPQIVTIEFLDWRVRVHKKIVEPLLNIDKKIRELALTDFE